MPLAAEEAAGEDAVSHPKTGSSRACGAKLGWDHIDSGDDSLTVPGTINGRPCELTVDIGSNISIVRPVILEELTIT